jgi:uncharacterized membrane protein
LILLVTVCIDSISHGNAVITAHARFTNCKPKSYARRLPILALSIFIHGSVEAYVNSSEHLYASLEIMLSLMLFLGSTLYVRFAETRS